MPYSFCTRFIIVLFLFAQSAWSSQWMAIMGDAGLVGPELSALSDSITTEGITSLILPGDNLYVGTYKGTWNQWKRSGFKFDVVAIGNHNGGYQKEINYFAMPGEYYSVEKNGARFLVLNSDNTQNVEQQFAWLEQEINQVKESLVFLVYHHPTFNSGTGHNWRVKENFQLHMRTFLKNHKKKITALLLGHEHISSFLSFGDIPAVVVGASCDTDKSSPVSYVEEGFEVNTRFLAPRTHHWAALEILDGAKEANIHFIRIHDQKKVCSAHFQSGRMELESNCQ